MTEQEYLNGQVLRTVCRDLIGDWRHLRLLALDPNHRVQTLRLLVRQHWEKINRILETYPGLRRLLSWQKPELSRAAAELRKPVTSVDRQEVANICTPAIQRLTQMRAELRAQGHR